jgi:hypothetical protein
MDTYTRELLSDVAMFVELAAKDAGARTTADLYTFYACGDDDFWSGFIEDTLSQMDRCKTDRDMNVLEAAVRFNLVEKFKQAAARPENHAIRAIMKRKA